MDTFKNADYLDLVFGTKELPKGFKVQETTSHFLDLYEDTPYGWVLVSRRYVDGRVEVFQHGRGSWE